CGRTAQDFVVRQEIEGSLRFHPASPPTDAEALANESALAGLGTAGGSAPRCGGREQPPGRGAADGPGLHAVHDRRGRGRPDTLLPMASTDTSRCWQTGSRPATLTERRTVVRGRVTRQIVAVAVLGCIIPSRASARSRHRVWGPGPSASRGAPL